MDVCQIAPGLSRNVVHDAKRIGWKRLYGDSTSVLTRAREAHTEGSLEEAWTLYLIALGQLLVERWREHKAKEAQITPEGAIAKLRAAGLVDAWEADALRLAQRRPLPVSWRHIDAMAGIVEGFALVPAAEGERQEGTAWANTGAP